jgi:hypothetical protein
MKNVLRPAGCRRQAVKNPQWPIRMRFIERALEHGSSSGRKADIDSSIQHHPCWHLPVHAQSNVSNKNTA